MSMMLERQPEKSPTKGPSVSIRFRTRKELEIIRRAAKALNVSINTLASDATVKAAEAVLDQVRAKKEAEHVSA